MLPRTEPEMSPFFPVRRRALPTPTFSKAICPPLQVRSMVPFTVSPETVMSSFVVEIVRFSSIASGTCSEIFRPPSEDCTPT